MCTTPAADDEKKHLLLTARWNGLAITAHGEILSRHLHFPQLERLSGDSTSSQVQWRTTALLGAPYNCMSNSNSTSNPTASRVTLKLKGGARKKPVTERKTPAPPQAHSKADLKPGAHWSDEYKERMQAEMDALASR